MATEFRKSGISVVGDVPWGTHFCHFYETKQDLLDTLIPYFKAGLESKEFCVWVVSNSELITVEEAKEALARAVPDLDRHLADENIEILNGLDWYLEDGVFNLERVTRAWDAKLKRALVRGYDGMRVSGDTFWLTAKDWKDFFAYEKQLNDSITDQRMTVLCTYPLAKSGAAEVLDVVHVHQFAIARRQGEWEVIETPELRQAKQEIKRLNEELEQRVVERTHELVAANEALKNEIAERRRIEEELRERAADLTEAQRVAKMGNWIFDLRANKVKWSDQLYRIFGIEARDFDGRYESFVSRIHPDDRPRVLRTSAQAKIAGLPFDIEYRIIAPNDEVRIIREVGYAAQDETGNIIRLFGTAQDITDRKLVEQALDERLRFETLVTELSAAFAANLSPNEVDREIDKWLRTLVEFLGVDRASFFQFEDDWTTLYRSHSYTVPGIEPLPPPIGMEEQFPWITDQLRQGITVKWPHVPDDMPQEAAREKEYAARVGAKSSLNIPVAMGGSVICAITFTSIATYHDWPDAMVTRLRLVGEMFAAAVERKRAEALLRKSEEQFRQMAENIREVFWLTTADLSKMLYISPAYEAVWGQSRESLYREPRSFSAAIHAEDRSRVIAIVERDREKGFEVEYRVVRPDGSIRWIQDRGFPIKDESGRFYRVAGIAADITERKEAEDALRRSEDRLRLVIDTVPALIHTGLPDGQLEFFNQRWLEFVGLSLDDLSGWKWTATIHPEDVAAMVERWRVALATGEPYDHEARVRRADGEYRWMVHREVPLRDERGSIVKWYASSIDIEDRKRAEDALRRSEDRIRLIIDTIPTMAWSLRPDGVVDFLNQPWMDYAGLSLEEYVKDPTGPIHPEDVARVMERWLVEKTVGEPYEEEMRLRRADGAYRWFLVRTVPLRDAQGNLVKWYGASTDIEDRKLAEEKLKSTSKQLRALSARLQSVREEEGTRIARELHDELGGALTSLKWDLEAVAETISAKGGAELQFQELYKKIQSMMTLTDTTINTVRRISSELRPIILDALGLTEAIEWQALQFQERTGIIVQYDYDQQSVDLNAEQSTALFRIFQEALTNVLRHAEATTIHIQLNQEDGEFILTISDNGRGITDDEKGGRRTLGLLGMRERAQLVGGRIEIMRCDGRGTMVIVRIPISG